MSGQDPINDVKRRLRERYLGVAGIHSFGVNRAKAAVRVYCADDDPAGRRAVIEQLRRDAAPFAVEIVVAQPPARIS